MATEWEEYKPGDSSEYVPVNEWGKDHWSTFGYVASCVTGREGKIENARMRCNWRLHREFAHATEFGGVDSRYPTVTKNGEIQRHDDWSCLEDACAAGLVKMKWRAINRDSFGCSEAKAELTDEGWRVLMQLTEHKSKGGSFGAFTLNA